MKLITSPGNKKFSELAETLLDAKALRTPAAAKEAADRLIEANPQLSKATALPVGTPLLVPDDLAGDVTEMPSPAHESTLAAVRQLQGMIPELRETLTGAYTAGKVQHREFAARLHATIGSEQGAKGAEIAARLKAVGEASAAVQVEAEKNKAQQIHSLSVIAKDLAHFLELHG